MTDRAILYRDGKNEFRWFVKARNGERIAASTEGYVRKVDAIANYVRVRGENSPVLLDDEESGLD